MLGAHLLPVFWLLLISVPPLSSQVIQDNSFLIEEAYNQERGVVQHIATFVHRRGGDWDFAFTQEWPLGGIHHQLSYTIPIQHEGGTGSGIGDVGLNYRYQLLGDPEARTVLAPRFTILLPTGNERLGRGRGGAGLQVNIPATIVIASRLVTHWNSGITITPSAHNALGETATTTDLNLGASAVWLLHPSFNLLVEGLWLCTRSVVGEGRSVRQSSSYLSPGARLAVQLTPDLQMVPGLAYTIALDSASSDNALFLYLSFEHPFSHQ